MESTAQSPMTEPALSSELTGLNEAKEKRELATLLFEHIEDQINFADTKAGLTLTADALLVGTIAGLGEEIARSLDDVTMSTWNILGALCGVLMFFALLLSAYYALLAIKPSLTLPKRQTLFFFGSIQQQDEAEFIKTFLSQPLNEANAAILAQVHIKAQIANPKFVRLRHSLNYLLAALVLWAVLIPWVVIQLLGS